MTAARRTLVLLVSLAVVLALAVGAAARFVARPEAEASARAAADLLALPFQARDAVGLVIAPRGGPAVRLDASAAAGLLERLSRVQVRARLPSDPALASSRGLDPPASRVTVELQGGRTLTLEIGDENPFDRSRFGRRSGEDLVLVGVPDAAVDPARDPAFPGRSGG